MEHTITIRRLDKVANQYETKLEWKVIRKQIVQDWCECASLEVPAGKKKRIYAISVMPTIERIYDKSKH